MGNSSNKSLYLHLSKDLEEQSRALYKQFAKTKEELSRKDLLSLLLHAKQRTRNPEDKIHDFLVPAWRLQEFVFSLKDNNEAAAELAFDTLDADKNKRISEKEFLLLCDFAQSNHLADRLTLLFFVAAKGHQNAKSLGTDGVEYFAKYAKKNAPESSWTLKQFTDSVAADQTFIESLRLTSFSKSATATPSPNASNNNNNGDLVPDVGLNPARGSTTIAIVGGGLSGLTCAYNLVRKGYTGSNITIIDSVRFGGRVFSFKASFPGVEGKTFLMEHGAAHVLDAPYYNDLRAIARKLDVYTLQPIPKSTTFFMSKGQTAGAVALFIGSNGIIHPLMDNLEKYYNYNTRADFSCGIYGRGTQKDTKIRNKLGLNLKEFVHRKGWLSKEVICEFLDFLCWMLATIRVDEIPVAVFVKMFPPAQLKAFVDRSALQQGLPWVHMPATYFEGGFGSVPDAMVTYLQKQGVKFSSERVSDVHPSDTGKPSVVLANNTTLQADRVILTSLWSEINHDQPVFFKSLPPKVQEVLNFPWGKGNSNPCVVSIPVYIRWNSNTPQNVIAGDTVICNALGQLNYPFVLYNNMHQHDPVYQVLCTVDSSVPRDQALATCKKNIVSVFTGKGGIFYRGEDAKPVIPVFSEDPNAVYWCPLQPNVSQDQYRAGFYDTLEDHQAVGGLYYSNIFTYFNYSGLVTQYATQLINSKLF